MVIGTVILCNAGCTLAVQCNEDDEVPPSKFYDSVDAMDYLHHSSPTQATIEERCKRYAVMASSLASRGPPRHLTMSLVLKMSEENVEQFYRRLDAKDELAPIYMAAIDGYRAASYIGPPFLELIECLKRLNRPYIKYYLENPELILILDLHKKIVQYPDMKIDLNSIDLRKFSPAFRISLENIFQKNLIVDSSDNQDRGDGAGASFSDQPTNEGGQQSSTEHSKVQIGPQRMVTTHRHREQERLRKRRLYLLRPDVERSKKRQQYTRLRDKRWKEAAERQMNSLRQLEESQQNEPKSGPPDQSSDRNKSEEQIPDLAQLWSEVEPIFESIQTPRIAGAQQRRHQFDDLSDFLPFQTMRAKPSALDPPRSSPAQNQQHQSQSIQPNPISNESESVQLTSDLPEPLPAVRVQPFQGTLTIPLSTPVDHPSDTSPAISRNPDPHSGPGSGRGQKYNYLEESPRNTQGQLDLPALPKVDQFEDIDSFLLSFSETPRTDEYDAGGIEDRDLKHDSNQSTSKRGH